MSYLHRFHHNIWGKEGAPKLVFLHGLMGSGVNWRKIVSEFETDYQVLAYDQRGHGRSFQPETGYAPEDYAEDMAAILDELGWDKIKLIGHSMGGRNALNFAFRFPERVEKLVIEDIGPESSQEAMDRIVHLLDLVPTPFDSKKEARDFFMNTYEGLIPDNPNRKVLSQYFYTNIIVTEEGKADWRFSKPGIIESMQKGRERDRWGEIEALEMPYLVVRGEHSNELSAGIFERMVSCNSKGQGVVIEDAAHWVHFDNPGDFVACLKDFL